MATDFSHSMAAVIVLALIVQSALAATVPTLRPATPDTKTSAEEEEVKLKDWSGQDRQSMVLKVENVEAEDPVFLEFSYVDGKERLKTDDPSRDSYNIINVQKANKPKLIPVDDPRNPTLVKDTENVRAKEIEESADDSVLQWNSRRRPDGEENVPGFHNLPKHIPSHLRPIAPFPELGDPMNAEVPSFVSGRETKTVDEAFLPSEKFPPPPRAGPYLYPQSVIERESRVPFY